ncbi:DNA-3-methyladenine glycosylase [uncultured Limosilactobacillus sp.]|uniref:DNA-3-methyladenine glycosylase n=1 Tax=uncultured Limosilactobacillus sp. TaxID=2837629 RepID=UPI0025EE11EA|nr:DNA-3-methyladenine glycosylase [uncultured Limosilactobacillus sp.]
MNNYQRFFTNRPTTEIAKDLLGYQVLYDGPAGLIGGLIVETEAYLGEQDSASHAYGGRRTNYTESLYGNPGDIYIYQIRSHYCFDVVVQNVEEPQGILIRAIEPTINVERMSRNRGKHGVDVTNGPGKLVQALGIHDRQLDGQSMTNAPLTISLKTKRQPIKVASGPRVGINPYGANANEQLRFWVADNPYVSKMRKRDADLENYGWRN